MNGNNYYYSEMFLIAAKADILADLLNEQQEVISSPIRFNGVSTAKIIEVFKKHGIELEDPF